MPNGGEGGEESDWCRVATIGAGKDRGVFFLPEVGDEVLCAFEHGDISSPFVVGALWNGQSAAIADNKKGPNHERQIRSRTGHTITLVDDAKNKAEKVTITSAAGARVTLEDLDGKLTIGLSSHDGKNQVLIDASGKKIDLVASEGSIFLTAKGTVVMAADQVSFTSKQATSLGAGGNAKVTAKSQATIKGRAGTIEAGSTLVLKGGPKVDINPAGASGGGGGGGGGGGAAGSAGAAAAGPGGGAGAGGGGGGPGGAGSGGGAGTGGPAAGANQAAASTSAPAQSGGSTQSAAAASPDPTLTVDAPGGSVPTVLVVGQEVTLNGHGSPSGGTYAWSVQGDVEILGARDTADVRVRARGPSRNLDDVRVTARYALGGKSATVASAMTALRCQLDVDTNRDGTVENNPPDKDTWVFGASGHGAVYLVNCDDGNRASGPDIDDRTITHGTDLQDIAPLVIRRVGPAALPAGHEVILQVDLPDVVRVFAARTVGAAELLGGGGGRAEATIAAHLDRDQTLGIEGLKFPVDGEFDGLVRLTLILRNGGGELARDTVVMRCAPWVMAAAHTDRARRLFVVRSPGWNDAFITALRSFAAAAGCPLTEHLETSDPWMQDCMEIGFSSIPGGAIYVVMSPPRGRRLASYPPTLVGPGIGFTEVSGDSSTFVSAGNFEVSPPVTAGGKRFPLGRIVTGHPGRPLEPNSVFPFFVGQIVQAPIAVDTTWLSVGHVDELMSFLPARDRQGFRLGLASARRALAVLRAQEAAGHGGDRLLVGRTHGGVSVERTITAFLADAALVAFNDRCQASLDANRVILVRELGLEDPADIVELPILFEPGSGGADALTAGVINMLIANRHCAFPMPFGPVVGGVDLFQREVEDSLRALGLVPHPLDDWDTYHVSKGEVHCGTNTLREQHPTRWWEFEP